MTYGVNKKSDCIKIWFKQEKDNQKYLCPEIMEGFKKKNELSIHPSPHKEMDCTYTLQQK